MEYEAHEYEAVDLAAEADETEVPRVESSVQRARPGQRVRVGPIAVPAAVLAWGLSLTAHAAVIVAACVAWHVYHAATAPHIGFSQGGAGVTLQQASDVPSPATFQTSFAADAPIDAPGTKIPAQEADRDEPPVLAASSTLATLHSNESEQPVAVGAIGASGSLTFGAPAKRRAAASGDSGSGDTPPGLPAAFARGGVPPPQYPLECRRRGEQGVVKVQIEVLPDGRVGQMRLMDDAGFPELGRCALEAAHELARYPFTPATRDGKPVASWTTQRYMFFLTGPAR